jgi:hypothetical protein
MANSSSDAKKEEMRKVGQRGSVVVTIGLIKNLLCNSGYRPPQEAITSCRSWDSPTASRLGCVGRGYSAAAVIANSVA